MRRLDALDGWRGISILLVLAAHLLPLRYLARADHMAATAGMAFFFCLSGYLITSVLAEGASTQAFFARRLARIVPLAWLYLLVVVLWLQPAATTVLRNFLFVANLEPQVLLVHEADHLWSLNVEVQFYALIGLLWAMFKRKSFWVVLLAYVVLVANRYHDAEQNDSLSLHRLDEILAGVLLYATTHSRHHERWVKPLFNLPLCLPLALVFMACSYQLWGFNSLRSLCCAWLVGASMQQSAAGRSSLILTVLRQRFIVYCAKVSYALYVLHPLLTYTWLGSGTLAEKYAKRPLLLLVLFALAHVSTKYFEPIAIKWARKVR
jgi:peptidoglycan/LPS O-acetylase OafA/YrhL